MKNKKMATVAIGTSLFSGLAIAASDMELNKNPFSVTKLDNGYMNTAEAEQAGETKMKDGACGEGKCGNSMQETDTTKEKETKNTEKAKKNQEGKCGEGKCGGKK